MTNPPEVNEELVDRLLSLPGREQQADFLREAGLLNADGLDRLLDEAERLLGSDPDKAERLAKLCISMADLASSPATVPRAVYVRAGVHNINGEFEEDLRLTQVACEKYVALGMSFEALRTNVGKMAALIELGKYQEALDTGQGVLDALGSGSQEGLTQQRSDLLTALVQQNRGGCLEYMGRYDEALDVYAAAERTYRNLGFTERVSEIIGNRGAVFVQLGRYEEALESYSTIADISSKANLTLSQAKALANIGGTYMMTADYTRSLHFLEKALALLKPLSALTEECYVLRNIADVYLALNLYSEALSAYEKVANLLQRTGNAHESALALWGIGSTLVRQLKLEDAVPELSKSVSLFEEANNVPLLSSVMLEQAWLFNVRKEHTAALTTVQQALKLVSGGDWPVQQCYAHIRFADLLLTDTVESEYHLLEAQRLSEHLSLPQLRYRLNERLGRLRRLQGRNDEARELLEASIEEIEHQRGTVTQDAMRASFLQDKTAAYEELLHLYLNQDDGEGTIEAFTIAERAKSRALVDLLISVVETETLTEDFELEKRLQTLQSELNVVYSQMLNPEQGMRKMAFSPLSSRAMELEQEISLLRLRASASVSTTNFPAFLSPLETTIGTSPTGANMVAYHTVAEEILAFVVASDSIRVVRRLSMVPKVQQLLQQLMVQWERMQTGKALYHRRAELLERSAQRVLGALYDELVAPLEELISVDGFSDNSCMPMKLTIVPHGLLHQIPFHALFDGEQYLLERFEVSYAPSATVYSICQERAPRDLNAPSRSLIMGLEDPTIPNVTNEIHAVAEHLADAKVLVGNQATVASLNEKAPGCDILHLACHGLFRNDNPMFSSLKLDDGWVTAADALQLDLDGALVTLSACESGRSEVIGGDEILGLTRAFLGAGASTLVVSLWLVQDETTAELMDAWYKKLRGGTSRASALREAQLEIKVRYPHPYYWAPFVLIGKR